MGESRGLSSLSVTGRVRLRGLEGTHLGSPYETAAAGHPLPIAPPPSSEAGHSTLRAAQVEHGVSHLVIDEALAPRALQALSAVAWVQSASAGRAPAISH